MVAVETALKESGQKVTDFLNSAGRNSDKTREAYFSALSRFQKFLGKYEYTLENIIEKILKNEVDIYSLFDNFISYLLEKVPGGTRPRDKLSPNTISLYVAGVRSYLEYYDIDINSRKFKRRVRLPKHIREDEEPIDASDIRKILLSCNNRRVKAYLLVLASSGLRANEATAIRMSDVDFSVLPTRIHIRDSKTKVARHVYISSEATKFLNEWLDWKYRQRRTKQLTPVKKPDDSLFSKANFSKNPISPKGLYSKINEEFHNVLKTVEMDDRKEGMLRRKVTLHSFRRFVYTTMCNTVDQAFAEDFLGHSGSSYHTMKEEQRREIYVSKSMKYLTFLDYSRLEATGKNVEAKLEEKDREIAYLRDRDTDKEDTIKYLSDTVLKLTEDMKIVMANINKRKGRN
ncbi:MAG: tyrosine-type recombinase/integrase [Nitrososphaeraceae archaeon]